MAFLRSLWQHLLTGTFWREVSGVRWTGQATGDRPSITLENPSEHPLTLVAAVCRNSVPEGDHGRWVAGTRLVIPGRRRGVRVLHRDVLRPGSPATVAPRGDLLLPLPALLAPDAVTGLVLAATVEGKAQKIWTLSSSGTTEVLRDDVVLGGPGDALSGITGGLGG